MILAKCVFVFLLVAAASADSIIKQGVNAACSTPLPHAVTAKGYCAFIWASNLGVPRGITVADNGDVIYVDQGSNQIFILWEDGSKINKVLLASASGLNHAVIIHKGYLYASSPTNVYRWPYSTGFRTNLGKAANVAINVPCCHHVSRALAFDGAGLLYVQSGSNSNVDPDSSHAQIRRFDISNLPTAGLDWSKGELFADGLRNEAGIRFDAQGQLWGVENGCDDLNRPDLGGDIHNDNPSEEVNLFGKPGAFYGYPYCWSEGKLANNKSHPTGAQWVHPDFMNSTSKYTDDWCRNTNNVVPPIYNLPAHTAPLDILFYYGKTFAGYQNDAFVSQHGSWDRQPASGYNVLHLKLQNGKPVSDEVFLGYEGPGATGSNWPHRPVGLAVGRCSGVDECLFVTSDASGVIIAIVPN